MPYAEVNGVRLFYTDEGEGPYTLLFIHGLTADSHDWNWVIPLLRPKYRLIACDLRGHGHSSVPDTYELRNFVDDIVALIKETGSENVVPVGHSLGGAIAAILAVEEPSLVSAVVEVDPAYALPQWLVDFWEMGRSAWRAHPEDPEAGDRAMPIPPAMLGTPEFLSTWNYRRMQSMSSNVRWKAYSGLADCPEGIFQPTAKAEEYLRRRTCPVLSFHSLRGRAAWEEPLFQHPASHAIEWEGSGHSLHVERPRELVFLITTWLDSLEKSPTAQAAGMAGARAGEEAR